MTGTFYVIGVGPGDPELLTLKAARLLEKCPVWFVPKAHQNGDSTALSILAGSVATEGKEILELHFPMKKVRMNQAVDPEVEAAWQKAAEAILEKLNAGIDVAFPTLGDPAIYSTGFYVCDTLLKAAPQLPVSIVPGVSSIGASAAAVNQPLCLGDDRMVVVPATFENGRLRETIEQFDTVVLMKVHRVMDKVVGLLTELDLLDKAVLVECSSRNDQRVRRDLAVAAKEETHYFSTIIVRK
ncbi:MAG: precorrin-2 C(20)-methyltransferase [Desulfobulbaceae bacterium]|nr:precorrin-2 C(20)-methyltransferase [Desulfobulbaceae bacterium]